MNAPQIITIVWFALSLLAAAHLHGKMKPASHLTFSFWDTFIWVWLLVWLLLWGGFFRIGGPA